MTVVKTTNMFEELSKIDVSKLIKKKGGLSYLSWPLAVDQLLRKDAEANWEFHQPVIFGETMMVSVSVTAFGKTIPMHLPVMDFRNQAIKNPDAFAVNKAMMRCLAKAIACHGIGLYVYAGEDLPMIDKEPKPEVVKTKDIELTSGKIIKTAGITGDQIKRISDITEKSNRANKELSFYLKGKKLPEMTSLNNSEADEVIELLQRFKKEPDKAEIPLEIKTQLYEAMTDMGLKPDECKQFFNWAVINKGVKPETLLADFTEWFDKFELEFNKPEVPEGELSHDDFMNGINE